MSVTIVLLVPLGPIPYLMNMESIIGVPCPAFLAVAVLSGLAVTICEDLKVLYMFKLLVCMVCIVSTNHPSPGKYIWICVTAAESKFVIFPTVFLKLTKPPHSSSPLSTVSKERYMLQLAIFECCFRSGMNDIAIMHKTNTPHAKTKDKIKQNLVQRLLQGSLSRSRRIDQHGGQLRSKRQQRTIPAQKTKQITPKIIYGTISSEIYRSRSLVLPPMTIDCTRATWEED